MRAMLKIVGLPKTFWVEVAKTSYYIINKSPSTIIEIRTPMEMWTNKPTNNSFLNIFRCFAYVMYNDQDRTKLDPKSRKCILLGYSNEVKGYCLWDPIACNVIISRDVIFIENMLQLK